MSLIMLSFLLPGRCRNSWALEAVEGETVPPFLGRSRRRRQREELSGWIILYRRNILKVSKQTSEITITFVWTMDRKINSMPFHSLRHHHFVLPVKHPNANSSVWWPDKVTSCEKSWALSVWIESPLLYSPSSLIFPVLIKTEFVNCEFPFYTLHFITPRRAHIQVHLCSVILLRDSSMGAQQSCRRSTRWWVFVF